MLYKSWRTGTRDEGERAASAADASKQARRRYARGGDHGTHAYSSSRLSLSMCVNVLQRLPTRERERATTHHGSGGCSTLERERERPFLNTALWHSNRTMPLPVSPTGRASLPYIQLQRVSLQCSQFPYTA